MTVLLAMDSPAVRAVVLLAMDRAPTGRRTDIQGFLHVAASNISKANVCPYMGREIPGWQALGLDGDRVYKLLRDPAELKAGAHTFDNLPILSEHIPIDCDNIPDDLIVGTTGSSGAFDGKYLTNSMALWKRSAIDGVQTNRKRQLSPGYRYTPVMEPGNYEGVQFDGKMTCIYANHVALVVEGRTGPDVLVGDENTMKTKTALMVSGALAGLVRPLLAQDAKVDLTGPLADVSAATLALDSGKSLAEAVHALAAPLLAADKTLTVEDVQTAISAVAPVPIAEDALAVAAPVVKPKTDDKPAVVALDEAAVQTRIDTAVAAVQANAAAIRTAERDVFPHIGEVAALDSAEEYYRMALDGASVDHKGVEGVVSLRAMVKMLAAPGEVIAKDTAFVEPAAHDELFKGAKPLVRS